MNSLTLDRRITHLQREMNVTSTLLQLGESVELLQPAITAQRDESRRCALHWLLMTTAPVWPDLGPWLRN